MDSDPDPMPEILAHILDRAGCGPDAKTWYHSQPIPALGGVTPETLVEAGKADMVIDYLDHLALGGLA